MRNGHLVRAFWQAEMVRTGRNKVADGPTHTTAIGKGIIVSGAILVREPVVRNGLRELSRAMLS